MDETTTKVFMGLVVFWFMMIFLTNMFEGYITPLPSDNKFEDIEVLDIGGTIGWLADKFFDVLDNVPFIKRLTPLLRIMSFRYDNDYIPYFVVIVLDILATYSIYITYALIRWET